MVHLAIKILPDDTRSPRLLCQPEGEHIYQQPQAMIPPHATGTLLSAHRASHPHPNKGENTAAFNWSKRFSISTASSVGPILRNISLLTFRFQVHSSTYYIPGDDNTMADAAYRLTHLTESTLIKKLLSTFLQPTLWRLLPLPPN